MRSTDPVSDFRREERLREKRLRDRINKVQAGGTIGVTPRELGFGSAAKEADIVGKEAKKFGLIPNENGISGSDHIPRTDTPIQFMKM